jgi:hypothetical protein
MLHRCELSYRQRAAKAGKREEGRRERKNMGRFRLIIKGGIMGKEKKSQETKEGNEPGTEREGAQEEIRALAYQLFCECGCEHGHDEDHWLEAERRVLG